ncbi:pRiA4b ORF-3-like protein [Halopseudomonas salegens]|uniref:PRiA4b ORF-3-like protein n=1 Tax=Halopseudomonas salegens TaxID=1434072 RepID=A0A1H2FG17_9GAMM|nr:pRiA4b ORF-3-like protein [Halopseudomonas salegens]
MLPLLSYRLLTRITKTDAIHAIRYHPATSDYPASYQGPNLAPDQGEWRLYAGAIASHGSALHAVGQCPPEDVGGIGGFYAFFLEAMADPSHPEHEDMQNWWGESEFDTATPSVMAQKQVHIKRVAGVLPIQRGAQLCRYKGPKCSPRRSPHNQIHLQQQPPRGGLLAHAAYPCPLPIHLFKLIQVASAQATRSPLLRYKALPALCFLPSWLIAQADTIRVSPACTGCSIRAL